MQIWVCAVVDGNPRVERNSCDVSDQMGLHTCGQVRGQRREGACTHLAASVELMQHAPVDDVPKAVMLVLRATAGGEDYNCTHPVS
jgi:hypothetical protein